MSAQATPEEIAFVVADAQAWPDAYVARRVVLHLAGEVAALRRQVEELGDVVPPPGFEVSEYAAINHIGMPLEFPKICKRGPGAWAAFVDDCTCIGKDAELHYELRPSNRTPEFIALTRFATPHAAARALRSGQAPAQRGEG